MTRKKNIIPSPLINELKQRIKECKSELLNLLEDFHFLQTVVQPRIMFVYETYFGDLENEIDAKAEIASQLDRRVELLSIKITRGEIINKTTFDIVDKIINKEYSKSNKKNHSVNYKNGRQDYSFKMNKLSENSLDEDSTREMTGLYRKLVKRLHPDVSGETIEFTKYWDNVQEAYKSNNLQRIKLFFQSLCIEEKEYFDPELEQAELQNEIGDLELSIEIEKRKLIRIKSEEPYCLEDKLNDMNWIASRKRKMREQLFQIDRQIHHNQKLLKALTSNFKTPVNSKNEFQETFASSTYFNNK